MHVIDKQRSLKSMSMFCFLAQGMHGELGMVPEARQDPTSHSASLESGYPVPRRVMPVGATHQGSPSGQGSSRHSPSVQNSRRAQDRKPVIESRSSTEFHIQRQVHPCKHMHLACLHDAQWGCCVQNPCGYISYVPVCLNCIVLNVCACLLLQWPNFGGQLLSMQLGEGGMGLSQGQCFKSLLTLTQWL